MQHIKCLHTCLYIHVQAQTSKYTHVLTFCTIILLNPCIWKICLAIILGSLKYQSYHDIACQGSCKSSRENHGLHWGMRGCRKPFEVRCYPPQDAWEALRCDTLGHHNCWANTRHTHRVKISSVRSYGLGTCLKCRSQVGQTASHCIWHRKSSKRAKWQRVLRKEGNHRYLGPVEGAVCWQRGVYPGEAASGAYKVKQEEGRWLMWHHTMFSVLFQNWEAEGVS